MKTIDRKTLEILRADIDAALLLLATKHGVSLKVGKGKYSNGSFGSLVIDIATISDSGVVETVEARDFRMMANLYGFEPDDLGRTFRHPVSRDLYTITGLRPRAGKRPILATSADGRVYVFPESIAKYVDRDAKVTA
jgi:hypothetical protein